MSNASYMTNYQLEQDLSHVTAAVFQSVNRSQYLVSPLIEDHFISQLFSLIILTETNLATRIKYMRSTSSEATFDVNRTP